MRRGSSVIFALLLLVTACSSGTQASPSASTVVVKAVCFSPHGGCTEAVVDALNGARKDVFVQAYSFTSAPMRAGRNTKTIRKGTKADKRIVGDEKGMNNGKKE